MGFPLSRVLKLVAIAPLGAIPGVGPGVAAAVAASLAGASKVLEEGEKAEAPGTGTLALAWDDKQEREWVKLAKKVQKEKKWTNEEKFEVVLAQVTLDMKQKEGLAGELADRDVEAIAKLVVSVAKAA